MIPVESFPSTQGEGRRPWRVAHVTDHYSAASGGVATVVDQLTRQVMPHCREISIVCVRGNPLPAPLGVSVTNVAPVWWANSWGWSPQLRAALLKLTAQKGTIFHIHGVWMAPQWLAATMANRHGVPFVLSSHAMLDPWFWNNQGLARKLKKKIYWSSVGRGTFARAGAIHAITPLERDNLREFFPHHRIEIIPNAIDLSMIDEASGGPSPSPEPIIFFLGRLHPQKGVDLLLEGFARSGLASPWRVVIAGPDWSPSYGRDIRRLAHSFGMPSRVNFIGPVFGKEKWNWLRRAWVVAVPSWAEVIAMVNLEAAGCGTPTVTTRETGLLDWEEGGGVLIPREIDRMSAALRAACSWSMGERLSRGRASRRLVEKRYSWDVVLPLWLDFYGSLHR
jgi:glycosyltransferase involved in cell wall biosynthesis